MKTETIYFPEIDQRIYYLIGENARDNFAVIDESTEEDIWFHAKEESSCHVVCILPNDVELNEKQKLPLIQKGAELCKQYTNKLNKMQKVFIIYTEIKNITKTKTIGLVHTKHTKTISLKV